MTPCPLQPPNGEVRSAQVVLAVHAPVYENPQSVTMPLGDSAHARNVPLTCVHARPLQAKKVGVAANRSP